MITSLTNSRVVLHLNKFIRLAWFPSEETNVREAYAILSACKDNKAILDEVPACIVDHTACIHDYYIAEMISNQNLIILQCTKLELHACVCA